MSSAYEIAFKLNAKLENGFSNTFKRAEQIAKQLSKNIDPNKMSYVFNNSKIADNLGKMANKPFNNAAEQLQNVYTNAFKNIESNASNAASNVIGTLSKIGTAVAGGLAIKDTVETYKGFEQSMANTAAIAGVKAGSDTYKLLEKAALDAGKATSKTAQESVEALGYMSLAGWSAESSMKGLMPILRASEATQADLATTSDLVTDSMSSLGLNVDELNRYLDVAAKANNKSNQTLTQLMESYIACGGNFKGFNTDITESAALLGTLANRGIKGAEAGNKMSTVLINLTAKSGQSYEAMKQLGIAAYDQQGKFKGVTKVLEELQQKTVSLTDEQRDNYFSMIGGKTQIDTLNALMGGLTTTTESGEIELYALRKELENSTGALNEMAGAVNNTMSGAFARLNSAVDDFKINMVKQFAPIITPAIDKVASAIPRITESLSNSMININNLGNSFSNGIKNIGNNGVQAFYPFFTQAQSILPKMFGETIGKSMTKGIARVYIKTEKLYDQLKPRLSDISLGAKYFVSNFSDGVSRFIKGENLSEAFSESLLGLKAALNQTFVGGAGLEIFDGIKSGLDKVSSIITTVKSSFGEIYSAYSESFGKIAPEIKPIISDIFGAFNNIENDKVNIFSETFIGVKDVIVQAAPVISASLVTMLDLISKIANGAADVSNFVSNNWSTIGPIALGIASAIGTIKMVKFALDVGKATKALTLLKLAKLKDKAETLILQGLYAKDAIVKGASIAATWSQTIAVTAWNGICGLATIATTALGAAFTFLTSPIGIAIVVIGGLIAAGVLLYKNWDTVKAYALDLWTNIVNVFNNIKEGVLGAIDSLSEKFPFAFDLISAYLGSWGDSIGRVIEDVKGIFSGIIGFVNNVFAGDWEAAWENVQDIFGKAFDALKTIATAPLNAVISLVNEVITKINGVKVPDFIPGIGGKSFNLPTIPLVGAEAKSNTTPGYATGCSYTPATFIAGEAGPELITNRAGSRVYDALQTSEILNRVQGLFSNDSTEVSTIKRINNLNSITQSPITIEYKPNITIQGNANDVTFKKLNEVLRINSEEVREIVRQEIQSINDRIERLSND